MAVVHFPALSRPASPTCSVCIANYDGEHLLVDCIESVLSQATDFAVEIIIHDDASGDQSLHLLRTRFPQVEVLSSSSNVGFCASNNRMVDHSRGEFVLLLNNDAALLPGALQALRDASRDSAVLPILTLPQYDWSSDELVDMGCLLDPFYNPIPNRDPARAEVAYAIGACLWISRQQWVQLGGLPEWMESIGEDIYLCCLARQRGIPVRTLSGHGFRHRLGSSFGGAKVANSRLDTTFRRRRLSERNKTFAMVVFTPGMVMWPLLAVHLSALVAEGVVLSCIRRDPRIFHEIYGAAIRSLWKSRRELAQRRLQVQRSRVLPASRYFSAFSWMPQKLALLLRFGVPSIR
jgi:GT2 family glycosyltransferase